MNSYHVVHIFIALLIGNIVVAEVEFEPYESNAGLVSAVAGRDFCIIAADTRMTAAGYMIKSRHHLSSRLWTINDDPIMMTVEESLRRNSETGPSLERRLQLSQAPILIGSAGCTADCRALQIDLRADLRVANHLGQVILNSPRQIATSLSQILYQRRGFPYYAFCIAAALDPESRHGHVYVYDAIGSYEQVAVAATGSGKEALQPILDRLFDCSKENPCQVEGSADNAVHKLCLAYRAVSEREIEVGDNLVLHVTEAVDGGMVNCKVVVVPLKAD